MEIKTQLQIHWDVDPKSMTLNTPDKKWVAVDDLQKLIKENIGNVDFTVTLQHELNKGR